MWVRDSDSKANFKLQNLGVALFTCAVTLAMGTGLQWDTGMCHFMPGLYSENCGAN